MVLNSTPRTFVGTTAFAVVGLTGSESEREVSAAIQAVAGVETVLVDAGTGWVTVTATTPVDRADIAHAIEQAGYTPVA